MIKRNRAFILLLTLLAITFAGRSDAQFWKKKSKRKHKQEQADQKSDSTAVQHPLTKKEKRRKEKEERKKQKQERAHEKKTKGKGVVVKKTLPEVTVPAVKKRIEISYPPTIFKPRYRIDVLAPLYLDELVKGQYITYNDKIPEKAFPGVSFIEGVNIAADSLKKAGFSIDIYIHDVSSFSESPEMLTKGKLDSADLIIGAVQPHDISILAAFAKKKQVYFISALSPSDAGVRDNQYFTMIQPSLQSHCERIIKDIDHKYPGQKITVLYRTSVPAEGTAYTYLTADNDKISFKPLLCNSLPKKQDLAPFFDSTKTNVVVIPVLDIVYADSLLKVLAHNFPATRFEIYGMSSWTDIAALHKAKALANINVNLTDPFHFNPASPSGVYVERAFKKDYSGKTSDWVYRGYETLFWYANLLKQYGTVFKYTDNAPTPFTPFEISPQWDKNNDLLYNENTHLFISRYENGTVKTE